MWRYVCPSDRGLRALLLAVVSVCVAAVVGSRPVAAVPSNVAETTHLGTVGNANWYGAYIPVAGGVKLYADVLVPRNRAGRVPTVLAIGPYFQHLRPQPGGIGVQAAEALRRSSAVPGCSSAATRWSSPICAATGPVADARTTAASSIALTCGRPCDGPRLNAGRRAKSACTASPTTGITGLMAAGERIPGLAAVVAQEPVYDWYRYLYGNGVPRTTRIGTPLSLVYTSVNPPSYVTRANSRTTRRGRPPTSSTPPASRRRSPHSRARCPTIRTGAAAGIMEPLKRSRVPIFLTQGFIDQEHRCRRADRTAACHQGPVTGWLGMWDHVRGNDTDRTALMGGLTDRPSTGRGDYLEQVGRFYDHYLKGKGTAPSGFLVQDNTGSWRAQSTWPDQASIRTVPLRPGTHATGLEVATKVKAKGKWLATQIDGVAAAANVVQRTADSRANGVDRAAAGAVAHPHQRHTADHGDRPCAPHGPQPAGPEHAHRRRPL